MSNNNQSSVRWLIEQVINNNGVNKSTFEQAKSQHKKEIIDFALHCMMPNLNPDKSTIATISDIYNEFFGGDE